MAYIDTLRRVPRITVEDGVFDVDYFRLETRTPRWARQGPDKLSLEFELQGIHRSLRLAGAKPGDTIRVGRRELQLWDYPDPTWMASRGTDGVLHYDHVLTEPLDTADPSANVARAAGLATDIASALTV